MKLVKDQVAFLLDARQGWPDGGLRVPETIASQLKDVQAKWFGFVANSKNRPLIMPPVLVSKPARVAAAGTKPKLIDEYIGRVNTETQGLSVAHYAQVPAAG